MLQGCFSGGFLYDDRPAFRTHTLKNLKNITVLTASKNDRVSFGCDPGREMTYYGAALLHELAKVKGKFESMNWKNLHQEVDSDVSAEEDILGILFHSMPQYFNN